MRWLACLIHPTLSTLRTCWQLEQKIVVRCLGTCKNWVQSGASAGSNAQVQSGGLVLVLGHLAKSHVHTAGAYQVQCPDTQCECGLILLHVQNNCHISYLTWSLISWKSFHSSKFNISRVVGVIYQWLQSRLYLGKPLANICECSASLSAIMCLSAVAAQAWFLLFINM